MNIIRNRLFVRLWSLTIVLVILNLSVDAPDFHGEYIDEDLTYNEAESIFEYVLENCLEYGNVIPESDDNDDDSKFKLKKIDVLATSFKSEVNNLLPFSLNKNIKPNYITPFYHLGLNAPQSPPPWI